MRGEEIIDVLTDIRDLLERIDDKLGDIRGIHGIYSLQDVYDKLCDIENSVDALDN